MTRRRSPVLTELKPRGRSSRLPMFASEACGGSGTYWHTRLPTADEQARGEWPERDEED